ncbi:MAG: ATP-binding protein [Bacteroidota bacterium]
MESIINPELIDKLTPIITEEDKKDIISYYTAYEKYAKEINDELTAKLLNHPIFGDLIKNTPKEIMEETNRVNTLLQKNAIYGGQWREYIEHNVQQGVVYAQMGFEFNSWYELITMARIFIMPYLSKEYGNSEDFYRANNGMNYFIDIGMGVIGEAYMLQKNEVISKDKEKIKELNSDLERKIQKAKEHTAELETLNNELNSFSYSVSHDLRAPLRAINGYAQILTEDYGTKFDEEGKRLIEVISSNATKMGILIDELLAFSKLGRKEINKTEIDMNELTENVINEYNNSFPNKAKINVGKLHKIHADTGLIYQVMFNILSNAVKYSSKKESPLVEISSEDKGDEVVFAIKDNGAGFDMKYSDKLFGVFQRLHSQDEFEGVGVGLALVNRIISKHNGQIWAEAKINEGATFYFSLIKD